MKDELISFDTAKLAKEKGFEVEVISYYKEAFPENLMMHRIKLNFNQYVELCCSAPTQSLLQKWLREKHKIIIEPWFYDNSDDFTIEFAVKVCYPKTWSDKDEYAEDSFKTYEKALEKGLKEALKLLPQTS